MCAFCKRKRTQERDITYSEPRRECLNAKLLVALHIRQVLGDCNDRRKHRHEARDEPGEIAGQKLC